MAKKAMSVTLDEANVLWLKGRARIVAGNNVSELLDQLVTEARTARGGGKPPYPSVVGMVDLSDDPTLEKAEAFVKDYWAEYLSGVPKVSEDAPGTTAKRRSSKKKHG